VGPSHLFHDRQLLLDNCARRGGRNAGNPAQDHFEATIMNTVLNVSIDTPISVFGRTLSLEEVRERAPAVFADSAHERVSAKYTFIPTAKVLSGLMNAGFVAIDARQARVYRGSALHALHAVRLRRRCETVALRDSVPEILLWNSHDTKSTYNLRMSLYRAVCTNGLVVSRGAFPTVCVPHRGNVVEGVVTGALEMSERFDLLAAEVERMEARPMLKDEQLTFAERALALRFDTPAECGVLPAQLLTIRRREDLGNDLYTTLNRVQENLTQGGLSRRTLSGHLIRTRRVTSIRNGVKLNAQLWDLAREVLTT
jgi:hypothetical protein